MTLFAMLAAIALVGLSCTDDGRPPLLSGLGEQSIGLRTDLSCDDLVTATKTQFEVELAFAESQMAGGGFATTDDLAVEDFMVKESDTDSGASSEGVPLAPSDPGAARESAPQTSASSPEAANADDGDGAAGDGEVVAGTNNQESGVDEADIVKTDGKRIVSLVDGVLRVVGLDGSPAVDGALDLSSFGAEGAEMFLRGDEALLLLPAWGTVADLGDDIGLPEDDVMTMEDDAALREQPIPGDVPPPVPSDDEPTTVPGSTEPETTTTPPSTTASTTSSTTSTTSTTTTTTSTTTTTTVPEVPEPAPLPFDQGVRILRVDLGAAGAPAVVEQRAVEGQLVAARMIDGTARVVVRSMMPVSTELQRSGDIAEARTTIDEMDPSSVMPRAVSLDGDGIESLGACGDVSVMPVLEMDPSDPLMNDFVATSLAMEPSTVSVLTVGDELGDLAPATVAGLADVVYASTDSMFVTSTGWDGSGPQTLVHQFDLVDEGPATYTGSGAVPGTPLNQYSLSERNGDLRIVTTTEGEQVIEDLVPFEEPIPVDPGAPIAPGEPDPNQRTEEFVDPAPTMFTTEGRLTVLRPGSSGTLEEIGVVEDLGVGESVQSVRFLGDMAYVVTFRQTDPLYAIDLSDPTDPKALGELKITGFSQYLHPVGDGLLLGVGREATEGGMDTGFKASLFDVSDPTNPTEIDKVVIPDANSLVASDPLAFTWDPEANQAIIPLERYDSGITQGPVTETQPVPPIECGPDENCGVIAPEPYEPVGPTQVALVLRVEGDQLVERAELSHQSGSNVPWPSQILRSVVVDRDLWTLSQAGLGLSNADNPTGVDLLPF